MVVADEPFDDYANHANADDPEPSIAEYDLSTVPSDFNVMTLKQLVDNGWLRIPGFQRHFVWDLTRASKLIESLILGVPVPQLFLYEQDRDHYLLIDGQQRLMSIYYFKEQRFPRPEKRADIWRVFSEHGKLPEELLQDDEYFRDFKLRLPSPLPDQKNRLSGLNYSNLGDYQSKLDMRAVRCIHIRQNGDRDDDAAMYEVFNRLNTGGVSLRPQEIRNSMYHSDFYDMLSRINVNSTWRGLLQSQEPDLYMKDIEVLLRGFAMLIDGDDYRPSMIRFLNHFSKKCADNDPQDNKYLQSLFCSFMDATSDLADGAFINPKNNRFNIALYEAVFTATCREAYGNRDTVKSAIRSEQVDELRRNERFNAATLKATTQTDNVQARLAIAEDLIHAG